MLNGKNSTAFAFEFAIHTFDIVVKYFKEVQLNKNIVVILRLIHLKICLSIFIFRTIGEDDLMSQKNDRAVTDANHDNHDNTSNAKDQTDSTYHSDMRSKSDFGAQFHSDAHSDYQSQYSDQDELCSQQQSVSPAVQRSSSPSSQQQQVSPSHFEQQLISPSLQQQSVSPSVQQSLPPQLVYPSPSHQQEQAHQPRSSSSSTTLQDHSLKPHSVQSHLSDGDSSHQEDESILHETHPQQVSQHHFQVNNSHSPESPDHQSFSEQSLSSAADSQGKTLRSSIVISNNGRLFIVY